MTEFSPQAHAPASVATFPQGDAPASGIPVPEAGAPTPKSVVRAVIIERAHHQLTHWQEDLETYCSEWANRGYAAGEARRMAYAQMCGYFEHHIRCLLAILEDGAA